LSKFGWILSDWVSGEAEKVIYLSVEEGEKVEKVQTDS
jgi:hypothetical protein